MNKEKELRIDVQDLIDKNGKEIIEKLEIFEKFEIKIESAPEKNKFDLNMGLVGFGSSGVEEDHIYCSDLFELLEECCNYDIELFSIKDEDKKRLSKKKIEMEKEDCNEILSKEILLYEELEKKVCDLKERLKERIKINFYA